MKPEHVDLSPGRALSWRFLGTALPDTWGMLRAVAALLGERDRGKDS